MKLSARAAVEPFIVMDVMEAARAAEAAGRRIIHMEVGQPSAMPPALAFDALADEMRAGPLGYTVTLGLPELRAAIAALYGDWYGVDLDPARVVITSGASGAFLLAFTALFDPGARVGLGMPCYPSYRQILTALSLTPVGLRSGLDDGFHPRPEQIAGLDGLIVASPGNPTGSVLGRAAMAALMERCAAQGTAFISDEIYHGLDYGPRPVSALELGDEAYIINSFSKFFTLTGWRIGWMVVPEAHVRAVECLAQNMFICAPHVAQRMALHALAHREDFLPIRDSYARARAMLLERLPQMGISRIAPPDGAFYVYADLSDFTDDTRAFATRILDEAGVALAPGADFDPEQGHRWMRFSFARGPEHVAEGLDRLAAFFAGLRR